MGAQKLAVETQQAPQNHLYLQVFLLRTGAGTCAPRELLNSTDVMNDEVVASWGERWLRLTASGVHFVSRLPTEVVSTTTVSRAPTTPGSARWANACGGSSKLASIGPMAGEGRIGATESAWVCVEPHKLAQMGLESRGKWR